MTLVPNIMSFRSRYPEFKTVDDPEVQQALDFAALQVNKKTWVEDDYANGLLLWAAHWLSLKQMQVASSTLGGSGATDIFVESVAFGERHISFGTRGSYEQGEDMSGPGEKMLGMTLYGQLFLQLRARNAIPVVIV